MAVQPVLAADFIKLTPATSCWTPTDHPSKRKGKRSKREDGSTIHKRTRVSSSPKKERSPSCGRSWINYFSVAENTVGLKEVSSSPCSQRGDSEALRWWPFPCGWSSLSTLMAPPPSSLWVVSLSPSPLLLHMWVVLLYPVGGPPSSLNPYGWSSSISLLHKTLFQLRHLCETSSNFLKSTSRSDLQVGLLLFFCSQVAPTDLSM